MWRWSDTRHPNVDLKMSQDKALIRVDVGKSLQFSKKPSFRCFCALWVTGGTLSLPGNLCLTTVGRQRRLAGRCLIIASCLLGFCFGRGAASEHRYGAITEAALLLLTDGCVCVCVCFCPHLGKNLVWWGKGGGVWRGRGGGEMWGEVSRGAAGETPTPASCCLRWAHPQPGCLPACPNPKLSDLPYSDLTPRKKKTHTHTH